MVLSSKFKDEEMVVFDNVVFDGIKTKEASNFLDVVSKDILKKERKVKTLLVMPSQNKEILLSMRNIPSVKIILADSLNIGDLLSYKYVVFLKDSIDILNKVYFKK
jgi:large subunit ribosomal protein L4